MSFENSIDDSVQEVKDQDYVAPFEADQVHSDIQKIMESSRLGEKEREQARKDLIELKDRIVSEARSIDAKEGMDKAGKQSYANELALYEQLIEQMLAREYPEGVQK